MTTQLGALLLAYRHRLYWTQERAAKALDISEQYLCDIEYGRREPSGDLFLQRCAEVYQVPVEVLYYVVGKLPPDCRSTGDEIQEDIVAAYAAFRAVLRGEE